MEHKVLYIVGIVYMPQPEKTKAPFPLCILSLQLGDTPEECIKAAEKQATMNRNFEEEGFKWTGSFVKLVTPEEIERLNDEAGTVAVMPWPENLPD